jgi:putative methyltransferase (TIGR04325 family)
MIRKIAELILPPFLSSWIKSFYRSRFTGNYKSWDAALNKASGYDSSEIIEKVTKSALMVAKGQAVFERDSVILDSIEYSWPLLAGLMWIKDIEKGNLNMIDFGGALGSTYYQNREFFKYLDNVHWNIVEQKEFVKTGKNTQEFKPIKFYDSIQECINENKVNGILFSSVITYLENPYLILKEVIEKKIKYIIFDRTFITKNDEKDIITLQKVPSNIYKASYPCWLLNEKKLIEFFNMNNYDLVEDFLAIDGMSRRFISKGFIFAWKNTSSHMR